MLTRRVLAVLLLGFLAASTGMVVAAPSRGLATPTPVPSGGAGCDPTATPWCSKP